MLKITLFEKCIYESKVICREPEALDVLSKQCEFNPWSVFMLLATLKSFCFQTSILRLESFITASLSRAYLKISSSVSQTLRSYET